MKSDKRIQIITVKPDDLWRYFEIAEGIIHRLTVNSAFLLLKINSSDNTHKMQPYLNHSAVSG
ncbi:hypothetical protein A9Q83_15100 [Alphaproteobacteria bacterium 46_93_T64]|nr:hypothetical protein A9Q83_15100 [Alphaproteobacteria bacterium 46_93_T64]